MAKKRKLENKQDEEPEEQSQDPPVAEVAEDEVGEAPEEEEDRNDPRPVESAPDPTPAATATDAGDGRGDASEDESDSESLSKLIEPFSKEQLIELLHEAALKYPDVLERVNKVADVDPAHRKIFVHGLGWDTTAETLINAFKKYGEIEDCNAVCDKISGKSKGYGFILFKHRSGARKALKEPQKRIGNRMTACQLASSGPVPPPAPPVSEYTQRKIYVSNVSADIDPQRLLHFFAKYGEIEEGPLGLDKQTGKPKGFTLFVYKAVESARKALEDPHKNFEGHILHCQKAIDGPKPNKQHQHHHPHHGHHSATGSNFPRNDNPNFIGGVGTHAAPGNMMAPATGALPFNQGAPPATAVNPLGQAVAALLATQGTGFGLTNFLGSLGSPGMAAPVNQNMPGPIVNNTGHGIQAGYTSQPSNISPNMMGGYGTQPQMQGSYGNNPMGQANTGRSQQGMGHLGGVAPYMGH
ncbi:hypothetical protein H6P81_002992 [Aristolochia fimbriata]|uniref:RRM domain-containing protein n=1 Tax=Aristolochia fimbriata TaxID=158543 RepID=A0AAV7FD41_ARIFI|nr:hypothetical protein H6P81_002992 [Aristolochia fimbriata]